MATKSKLLNQFPKHKELIHEQWNWYSGEDEFGRSVWNDEFDTPKTQANIYDAVLFDIEFHEEHEDKKELKNMAFCIHAMEYVSKEELAFYERLSKDDLGIYGN
ncbi:hypothetical protein [Poseidonibacter ostreae]|uniref:Uncharacterized protein n=1 Tax=Poseidonibacter ostreae TaxID=2654171 RepID=A0A6L4WWV9_9BACT|nr:hypothetical protein [Poseidonibacter ostreae]KAB7891367.1 hypothetical protein GBG19_00595 [Poseidonibacter ostreae]